MHFEVHGFMDVHFLKDLIKLLNGLLKYLCTSDYIVGIFFK